MSLTRYYKIGKADNPPFNAHYAKPDRASRFLGLYTPFQSYRQSIKRGTVSCYKNTVFLPYLEISRLLPSPALSDVL